MIASYRLQLIPEFGFAEVQALVPYLQQLGVSHLYLSPITESRPGSTHGYDVMDHNEIRTEFGGQEGLDRLLESVCEAGLQVIFDFVPNHAGVGPHNEAWQSVLAYGYHSPYARYFDIDWNPLEETLQGKVLLPLLGRPYGEAVDAKEIQLVYHQGRFYAGYFEDRFALSPATYTDVLEAALPHYERMDVYFDLKDLQQSYATLSAGEVEKAEILHRRLEAFEGKVDWQAALAEFEGNDLHELLERQWWRLAYWKTASYEINYRRFFDVNGLVALRMEDEEVFWKTHRLLGDLITHEGIAGVRIDHIDGLFDPHAYLTQLHELGVRHVWVEKILGRRETLPEDWPVEGTTGYEFMNDVMTVLLKPEGMEAIQRIYSRYVPEAEPFDEVVRQSKQLVMDSSLSSELYRLSYQLNRLCKSNYHTRDFTLGALRDALSELVAALDRYRTYLPYDPETAREVIRQAVGRARQRTPAFEPSVYDFIARIILGEVPEELRERQQAWVGRFQQYTAPVAAKGVEDTAFYRYLPLVALNEVGGEPELPEQPVQAFHSHARMRATRYPLNLLATATHDHKRGEDTRLRLIALTEVPDLWDTTLHELSQIGQVHHGLQGPSRFDEYLFYQILVALWVGSAREELPNRLWEYMQKASRESKRRTSWNNPNESYEQDLERFIRECLSDPRLPGAVEPLAQKLAEYGFCNGLSQVVLKFTMPGLPDLYQGCELADLSLVDPDNRRAVDYDRRRRLLEEFRPLLEHPECGPVRALLEQRDETAKFYFTAQLLRLRRSHSELLSGGAYRPLELTGSGAEHWLAFTREHNGTLLMVVVPRFTATWQEREPAQLAIPPEMAHRSWTDILSGERVTAGETLDLAELPLLWAVLRAETSAATPEG